MIIFRRQKKSGCRTGNILPCYIRNEAQEKQQFWNTCPCTNDMCIGLKV